MSLDRKKMAKSYTKCGSMQVSAKLHTHPSPNPTLTLSCYQLTVVVLGEEWVSTCSDTGMDPKMSTVEKKLLLLSKEIFVLIKCNTLC